MKSKTLTIILGIALIVSVLANTYQYKVNYTLKEQATIAEADISGLTEQLYLLEAASNSKDTEISALTEETINLQTTIDALQHPKEIFWTLTVADYEIFLQEGAETDTLDLMYRKDALVSSLLTFHKGSDYQAPSDITAKVFTECLGHNGFCLYKRHPLGTESHYYDVDYYTMDEELKLIAYRWGSKDENTYTVDVDNDGIKELICNVVWMADGVRDVLIYHFDGKQVLKGYGSDLLEEPVNIHGIGSIMTEYLPEKDKVHISYWNDESDGFLEAEYEIDLNKLELYEVVK